MSSTFPQARADERDILFISYAHSSRDLVARVESYLSRRAGRLGYEVWWDDALVPGRSWRPELEEKLARTGACIFIATIDAMRPESFIWQVEMPRFRDMGIPIAPLYAEHFDWEAEDRISDLGFLDPPGTKAPLSSHPPDGQAAVLTQVAINLHTWLPPLDRGGAPRRPASTIDEDRVGPSPPDFEPGRVYGVPALPQDYQSRDEVLAKFKEDILSAGTGSAAIASDAPSALGLHGGGGTGKSVMAAALATDLDVRRAFPDGVYWVTVGQERRNIDDGQAKLAAWLGCDISRGRTIYERRDALAATLAGLRCLVVVDDIWTGPAADAFNVAGPLTRVLYTTRDERLLTARDIGARTLVVGRYESTEALQFLATATNTELPLPPEGERVAFFTNGVVLSLSLAAGAFRHGLAWPDVLKRFEDSKRLYPDDEDGNLRAMRVALSTLTSDEHSRYSDLVVFQPDIPIPIQTIHRQWRYAGVDHPEQLLDKFENGGLLHIDRDHVRFHDDQLFYLQQNAESARQRHDELLASFRQDFPRWSDLDANEPYMWDHLVEHLVGAMDHVEAEELASDLRWIARRWSISGAGAVERDLAQLCRRLPEKHRAQRLHRRLSQAAHLVAGLSNPCDIANTLALHTFDLADDLRPLRSLAEGAWLAPTVPTWTSSDALVKVFNGHHGTVNSVVGLPRAVRQLVASGGKDGTVRIWEELIPDSESLVLAGHKEAVMALAVVFLDGRPWLASAGADRRILLWDIDDLDAEPIPLKRHTSAVLALSSPGPDSPYLLASGAADRMVRLWFADDPERPPLRVGSHSAPVVAVNAVAGADGLVVLTVTSDGRRAVWREGDAGRFDLVAERFDTPTDRASGYLVIDEEGSIAATSSDRMVLLWNPANPASTTTIGPLASAVQSLAPLDRARNLVVGCADGIVRIWDSAAPSPSVHGLHGHIGAVFDVCTLDSDRQRIASASEDGSVCVWDPQLIDEEVSSDGVRIGRLTAAAVLPTAAGRLAVSTTDRSVSVWDIENPLGSALGVHDHGSAVRAIEALATDETPAIAFGDDNGQAWVARLTDADLEVTKLPGDHTGPIRAMASFTVDDVVQLVSAGHDRTLVVRRSDGEGEAHRLDGAHVNRILALHLLHGDGPPTLLSAGADGAVRLWDPAEARSCLDVVELGHVPVNAICSFDGASGACVAAGLDDGSVEWWPVEAAADRNELRHAGEPVVGLAWLPAPGGGVLAVLTVDGLLELWDVASAAPDLAARIRVGKRALAVAPLYSLNGLIVAFDATWTALTMEDT